MRNISDKGCSENENINFLFGSFIFLSENRTVYEIVWKNMAEPDSPQMTI
jgi:hypothetical protein